MHYRTCTSKLRFLRWRETCPGGLSQRDLLIDAMKTGQRRQVSNCRLTVLFTAAAQVEEFVNRLDGTV